MTSPLETYGHLAAAPVVADRDTDVAHSVTATLEAEPAEVGERLRRARLARGLSLADVEQRSAGRLNAVLVASYEQGGRAVTLPRLGDLAEFYDLPVHELLPSQPRGDHGTPDGPAADPAAVTLDLERLPEDAVDGLDPIALRAVARFAEHINERRGNRSERVLTVRGDDLRTIAVAVGHEPDDLIDALRQLGTIVSD
ncbi:helix-turn-helix domain-containing protein [Egicoccus sp. AB-alg6-2]|uniref:helix-turn-helix domain-containing protein n=1 Tax=Egicoccus sp. AB-alg6-2 TaxID=3242692 RepID=UPI00359D2C6E